MDKIVYKPETYIDENGKEQTIVCVKKFEIYVDEGKVRYAVLQGGCNGGSQVIARVAQQLGDIEKVINVFEDIECGGSYKCKTSCSQQFAYVLHMYLQTLKGEKLPENDAQRLHITKDLTEEKFIEIEEKRKMKDKLYTKKNKFLNL